MVPPEPTAQTTAGGGVGEGVLVGPGDDGVALALAAGAEVTVAGKLGAASDAPRTASGTSTRCCSAPAPLAPSRDMPSRSATASNPVRARCRRQTNLRGGPPSIAGGTRRPLMAQRGSTIWECSPREQPGS